MAVIDPASSISSQLSIGKPQTRRETERLLIDTLRSKYGLGKGEHVSYGVIKGKYRVYSSKAGGYIDTRTGGKWDANSIKTTINQERKALIRAKAGSRFGGALQTGRNLLNRAANFSNAQEARNALSNHLQAKSQNWWQVRNLASPLDIDTGQRTYELDWEKQRKILEQRVNAAEGVKTDTTYNAPKEVLKVIKSNNKNWGGSQPLGEFVETGDRSLTPALKPIGVANSNQSNVVVNDSAKGQEINLKTGESKDNTDNNKTKVEKTSDSIKINKGEKKYNQRLLDAGFTTDQLDKLQTQHSDWKAAKKAGTLADWEAKYHPDRTPKYKNRKQLKAKAS